MPRIIFLVIFLLSLAPLLVLFLSENNPLRQLFSLIFGFGLLALGGTGALIWALTFLTWLACALGGVIFPEKARLWTGGMVLALAVFTVYLFIDNALHPPYDETAECRRMAEDKNCAFIYPGIVACKGDVTHALNTKECERFPALTQKLRQKEAQQASSRPFATGDAEAQKMQTQFTHYWAANGQPLPEPIQKALDAMARLADDIYEHPVAPVQPDPRINSLVLVKSCLNELDPQSIENHEHLAQLGLENTKKQLGQMHQAYEKFRKSHPDFFKMNGPLLNYLPEGEAKDACRQLGIQN